MNIKITETIEKGIFFLFSFLAILPNKLKGLPVVLLFIYSLYRFLKNKGKIFFPFKKVVLLSLLFLVLIPGILYSENILGIDRVLSTRLSLIIVPISLGLLYSSEVFLFKKENQLFSYFIVLGGVFYSIILLLFVFKSGYFYGEISHNELINFLMNNVFKINQHPIYASIFLGIPFLILIITFIESKKTILNFLLFGLINGVILIMLLLLARKGVLLSLVLTFVFILIVTIKNFKIKSVLLFLILIFSLLAFTLKPIESRFSELFRPQTYRNIDVNNSTSIRVAIYNCSLIKIKEACIMGYGLGDSQNVLNSCYKANNYPFDSSITYNSHNQYLSYYLSSGFLGFLVIVFVMAYLFINGIIRKNIYLTSTVFFFSIIMLFENVLERQSGVILFSFLVCVFYFSNNNTVEKS